MSLEYDVIPDRERYDNDNIEPDEGYEYEEEEEWSLWCVTMGRGKKYWKKDSHERAYARLLEQINNPNMFNSYENKKKNLDKITDDFPRY